MAHLDLYQFFDADIIELETPHSEGLLWFALNKDGGIVILLGHVLKALERMEKEGLNPLFMAQLSEEEIESLLE